MKKNPIVNLNLHSFSHSLVSRSIDCHFLFYIYKALDDINFKENVKVKINFTKKNGNIYNNKYD